MHFKHLFIFGNHKHIQSFHYGLEEMARFSHSSSRGSGFRKLSMMSHDGEHEIITMTIDDLERGRFRGMNFDKVSIHESVELEYLSPDTHMLLRVCVERASRGSYGGLGFPEIVVSREVSDDRMYFLNSEWLGGDFRSHAADALRYSGLIHNVAF